MLRVDVETAVVAVETISSPTVAVAVDVETLSSPTVAVDTLSRPTVAVAVAVETIPRPTVAVAAVPRGPKPHRMSCRGGASSSSATA